MGTTVGSSNLEFGRRWGSIVYGSKSTLVLSFQYQHLLLGKWHHKELLRTPLLTSRKALTRGLRCASMQNRLSLHRWVPATIQMLWTKQVKCVKFNRNIKENEKRQWHFNHNVQPNKKKRGVVGGGLLMVAFQTSVLYSPAKPTIQCSTEHKSAISHEGQTWSGGGGDLMYLFFFQNCWIFFISTFRNVKKNQSMLLLLNSACIKSRKHSVFRLQAFVFTDIWSQLAVIIIWYIWRYWRGSGASGCEVSWALAFAPFFKHQSMNDTWGTTSTLDITHCRRRSPDRCDTGRFSTRYQSHTGPV